MKTTFLEQIETYSKSIIAFTVLQGLAYSYYFGSNKIFNCRIKSADYLAETLTAVFVLVAILSILAVINLGKEKSKLIPEYADEVRSMTIGKVVVVVIFGFFPAVLTFFYGVLGMVPIYCQKL